MKNSINVISIFWKIVRTERSPKVNVQKCSNNTFRLEIRLHFHGRSTSQLRTAGRNILHTLYFQFSSIFDVLDREDSGFIEFEQFLMALSITPRGNIGDKLDCKNFI